MRSSSRYAVAVARVRGLMSPPFPTAIAAWWFRILGIEHVDKSVAPTPTVGSYSVLVREHTLLERASM